MDLCKASGYKLQEVTQTVGFRSGAAWLKGRNSQGEREEQKHPYRKAKKRKTYLTLTGLLMEGVEHQNGLPVSQ
jgi:hypothetical protein